MDKKIFISLCVIPTGIGASIGGFAGDASPAVNLLSKVSPVITNPNSINGAFFSGINSNILYTEGYAIDQFIQKKLALRPSNYNKIGVIFDKAIPKKVLNVHLNILNAIKSLYGIQISDYVITEQEIGVNFEISSTGISTGCIKQAQTLLEAGQNLTNKGAEALAVVGFFPDIPELENEQNNYSGGQGVDPIGGVEAVISHILTKEFNVPVAHAPAFSEQELNIQPQIVDARAAAEYIVPAYLPCIILGLYNAPKLIDINKIKYDDITIEDLKAVVYPYSCCGGIPVLSAIEQNIPVIVVKENKTILNLTPKSLGIEDYVIEVSNYYEVAGYLLALKNGISL